MCVPVPVSQCLPTFFSHLPPLYISFSLLLLCLSLCPPLHPFFTVNNVDFVGYFNTYCVIKIVSSLFLIWSQLNALFLDVCICVLHTKQTNQTQLNCFLLLCGLPLTPLLAPHTSSVVSSSSLYIYIYKIPAHCHVVIAFITKTAITMEKVSTRVLWTQGTPFPKRCALFLDFLLWKKCLQCIL